MTPYIITWCLVVLLFLIFVIRVVISTYKISKLTRLAEKELRILTLQIDLISTLAEYHFWQDEVYSFLTRYEGKVSPRFFIVCKAVLKSALNQRYKKGFSKSVNP